MVEGQQQVRKMQVMMCRNERSPKMKPLVYVWGLNWALSLLLTLRNRPYETVFYLLYHSYVWYIQMHFFSEVSLQGRGTKNEELNGITWKKPHPPLPALSMQTASGAQDGSTAVLGQIPLPQNTLLPSHALCIQCKYWTLTVAIVIPAHGATGVWKKSSTALLLSILTPATAALEMESYLILYAICK